MGRIKDFTQGFMKYFLPHSGKLNPKLYGEGVILRALILDRVKSGFYEL